VVRGRLKAGVSRNVAFIHLPQGPDVRFVVMYVGRDNLPCRSSKKRNPLLFDLRTGYLVEAARLDFDSFHHHQLQP
jgi:hypothetical protein